ncbi:MAG TPA: 2'-5' RNA ligase family protein [Pseudolabrys sp.]|nr:2'-5' RNA ligase family protein [Pseudolabrys sp.]
MFSQLALPGIAALKAPINRFFFAVLPDHETGCRIHQYARTILGTYGLHSKLIHLQRLHLSLQHLGDFAGVPRAWIEMAQLSAERVDTSEFDLMLDSALTFGGREKSTQQQPCVLMASDATAFRDLHIRICRAMQSHGVDIPDRRITPHVTMFYDHAVVKARPVDPIILRVREFVIVHSRSGTGQPFGIVGRWKLRQCFF